ncbi:hypothetical protein BT96DRAFT_821645 [Gymnopus androsaceus JB14]|uniref:KOW domain-containing protein n=1 Tax=Gymnopus androsaceus JB14 TaxID=1447944 RepID=A0A6A4HNF3_9AGAR|nr:hypothetical protein BT96DRAFT_821645 [Gymnopus androsaceus JB14]
MATLTRVPPNELRKTLTVPQSSCTINFIPGQWVRVKRGLYRGDVGCVSRAEDESLSRPGVTVLLVPRLVYPLQVIDTPDEALRSKAPFSKRKRETRPPLALLEPSKCRNHLQRISSTDFRYQNWDFSGGLILKLFSKQTLVAAQEIPSEIASLFQTVQEQHDGLVNLATMPLPAFWDFQEGERVLIIASNSERKAGTVQTAPQWQRAAVGLVQVCEINVAELGFQSIRTRNILKDISIGDFVEVVAGQHQGKSGFIAAKNDGHLGICKGTKGRGIVSCWFFAQSPSQQEFNIEFPWRDVQVRIVVGTFADQLGIVKNVWRDFRGFLRLLIYITNQFCSIELDHCCVVECRYVYSD